MWMMSDVMACIVLCHTHSVCWAAAEVATISYISVVTITIHTIAMQLILISKHERCILAACVT